MNNYIQPHVRDAYSRNPLEFDRIGNSLDAASKGLSELIKKFTHKELCAMKSIKPSNLEEYNTIIKKLGDMGYKPFEIGARYREGFSISIENNWLQYYDLDGYELITMDEFNSL